MTQIPEGFDWNMWIPPALALVSGLLMALWMLARRQHKASDDIGARLAALGARKELLLEQIRELEAERRKIPAEAYQEQREELLDQASETLAKHESLLKSLPQGRESAETGGQSMLFGLAVLTVGLVLVVYMSWSERSAAQPVATAESASAMGMSGMGMSGMGMSSDGSVMNPHEAAAQAAQEAEPRDLPTLAKMTHEAIMNGDLQNAMMLLDQARGIDPDDPDVLAHLSALRIMVGMNDRAEETLNQVLEQHPDQPRALLWLGICRQRQGDMESASRYLDRVLELVAPGSDLAQAAQAALQPDAQPAEGTQ